MKVISIDHSEAPVSNSGWLKRTGLLAFVFFLVKGLVWLGVAGAAAWFGVSG